MTKTATKKTETKAKRAEPEQWVVVDGLNFPPKERLEPGDIIVLEDLPEKSRGWLKEGGHIAKLTDAASIPAIELAAKHDDIRLGDIDGSGEDGKVTKPDVEKAIAAAEEEKAAK